MAPVLSRPLAPPRNTAPESPSAGEGKQLRTLGLESGRNFSGSHHGHDEGGGRGRGNDSAGVRLARQPLRRSILPWTARQGTARFRGFMSGCRVFVGVLHVLRAYHTEPKTTVIFPMQSRSGRFTTSERSAGGSHALEKRKSSSAPPPAFRCDVTCVRCFCPSPQATTRCTAWSTGFDPCWTISR